MKEKINLLLICILFVSAFAVVMYPIVSNLQNERLQKLLLDDYKTMVENIPESKLATDWKRARKYNENLVQSGAVLADPFDPQKYVPDQKSYEDLLNPNKDGVMGMIEIPKISLKLPIKHGTKAEVLANAVGHLEGTSLPTGGEGTHTVLSAHRGLPSAELFTNLDQLEIGDTFCLYILDEVLYYEIDQVKVVEPKEIEDLKIEAKKDQVTLITCTPYSINSHRLLVRGQRCEEPAEEIEKTATIFFKIHTYEMIVLAIAIIAAISVIVIIKRTPSKKQTERGRSDNGE